MLLRIIPSPVSNETNAKELFLPIIGELSKFITRPICFPNNEYWYYYQKSKAAEDHQKMLEVSAKNCDLDTLKLLIKKSKGDSRVSERALYDAAEKGCLEVVKFLLDEGVDINIALFIIVQTR